MKTSRSLMALLSLLLVICFTVIPLPAQQSGGSKAEADKNAPKIPVPRVSEAGFAREMVMNGRAVEDPYLLIQAAQLFIMSGKMPHPKGEVKPSSQSAAKKEDLDPANLLREAAKMAGAAGDKKAVDMAAEVARNTSIGLGNEALAGEISKTQVARGFAAGHSWKDAYCLGTDDIMSYDINFNGGEDASLSVSAYPPVTVVVYDGAGIVTGDQRYSTSKYLRWHYYTGGVGHIAVGASNGASCYSITIY